MKWVARVHVVPKPIVSDPQGEAVLGGLHSLGFKDVAQVRSGKYMEIHIEAGTAHDAERQVDDMCRKLLANPVIEDYSIEMSHEIETKDAV